MYTDQQCAFWCIMIPVNNANKLSIDISFVTFTHMCSEVGEGVGWWWLLSSWIYLFRLQTRQLALQGITIYRTDMWIFIHVSVRKCWCSLSPFQTIWDQFQTSKKICDWNGTWTRHLVLRISILTNWAQSNLNIGGSLAVNNLHIGGGQSEAMT